MITPENYIGGYINKIEADEAEEMVKLAIKNKYEYIQIGHIRNGLGPRAMFNYYQLKIRASDYHPPDKWEISTETMQYLSEKYKEIKLYI